MTPIRRISWGIFLLSLSLLLFELTLIRLYSAILFYHFAFMAVSVAMLGLSAAGITVHLKPHWFTREASSVWGFRWTAAYAGSIFAALILVFKIPVNAYLPPSDIAGKLTIIYLISAIPFYFAGLTISGLFVAFSGQIGRLYAWDLIGAGLGAVMVIPLMNYSGGDSAGLFVVMLAFLAAAMLGGNRWKMGIVLASAALLLALSNPIFGWVKIHFSKGQSIDNLAVRFNRWNSFSRIMVIPFKIGTDAAPQTWCPSPRYLHLIPNPSAAGDEFYSIMIDDGASTPIVPFRNRNLADIEYLKYDLTSLPHRIRGNGRTLIIGSGGGRDVLSALAFGAEQVDAVDINPLIFKALREPVINEYCGDWQHHPRVQSFVAEGRAFARRRADEYDLIQIAMIDTWAATTAGAYALSENNLYTVEAFRDYLRALKPGGIIAFTRFYFSPPRQTIRLASIFLEAAKLEGIPLPEQCIMVGKYESLATILFKKEPFTDEEQSRFKTDLADMGFNLVYIPNEHSDPWFKQLIQSQDRDAFYRHYEFDITPATDERPFFFNMLKMRNFLRVLEQREGQKFNYYATYTLVIILIISIIATIVVLILPTLIAGPGLESYPGRERLLGYFLAIGLGYILTEITLLQRFTLLLEHPAYAASGVLAGMLISSGVGSWWWHKSGDNSRLSLFNVAFLIIGSLLLFHSLIGAAINHLIIGMPLALKVLASLILIIPLGWAMGVALPAGITMAAKAGPGTVAWCWAINGAASVLASSLAVAIAMASGFARVLQVSLISYMLAFALMSLIIGGKHLSFKGSV